MTLPPLWKSDIKLLEYPFNLTFFTLWTPSWPLRTQLNLSLSLSAACYSTKLGFLWVLLCFAKATFQIKCFDSHTAEAVVFALRRIRFILDCRCRCCIFFCKFVRFQWHLVRLDLHSISPNTRKHSVNSKCESEQGDRDHPACLLLMQTHLHLFSIFLLFQRDSP